MAELEAMQRVKMYMEKVVQGLIHLQTKSSMMILL